MQFFRLQTSNPSQPHFTGLRNPSIAFGTSLTTLTGTLNDNTLMATIRHATAGFAVRQLGLPLCNSSPGWDSLIATQVWKDPTHIDANPLHGLRFNSTSQFITHAILNSTAEPSALVLYSLANSLNCNIMLSLPSKELAKAYALSLFDYVDCTVLITVADGLPDAHILFRGDKYHAGSPPPLRYKSTHVGPNPSLSHRLELGNCMLAGYVL